MKIGHTAENGDPASANYLATISVAVTTQGVAGDGDMDPGDLAALLGAYGACAGLPNFDSAANFDGNGCIELADLAALLGNYRWGL